MPYHHQLDLSEAIAYCRVSTEKQANIGHALERYILDFKQYGFKEEQIYYDVASGGDNQREGYLKALEQVKQGVKKVYVPEITRFSRSVLGFEEAIVTLQKYGAELLTLDGHTFDLSTPTGLTEVRLRVVFSEQERRTRQYQALKGLEHLRRQGKPLRAVAPYKIVENGTRLIPNYDQYKDTGETYWQVGRNIVKVFLDCRNYNQTMAFICDRYGAEKIKGIGKDFPRNTSGLKYWLASQTLRGNIEYFVKKRYKYTKNPKPSEIIYNKHQALISPDESYAINQIVDFNRRTQSATNKIVNPLIGKVFCTCGGSMKKSQSKPKGYNEPIHYMLCSRAYPNNPTIRAKQKKGELPTCDRRSSYGLTLKKLEQAIIQELKQRSQELADFYFPTSEIVQDPQIAELDQKIAMLQEFSQQMADVKPLLAEMMREREQLVAQNRAEGKQQQIKLRQKLIEYAQDDEFWAIATVAEKQTIFGELIDTIVCDQGKPQVYLAI